MRFHKYPFERYAPNPAPSLRELSAQLTEGVSSIEWYNVKFSGLRRGDENRPHPCGFASTHLNGTHPPGSLSEGAAERSEAEGVYFDERNRLKNFRANKSLCVNRWPGGTIGRHSLSLAFARQLPQGGSRERLRECVPFNRVLAKLRGCGRFSSPLRFCAARHKRVAVLTGHRHRAGQGTNVSVQSPCVIVRRHCRPAQKDRRRKPPVFAGNF